MKTPFYSLLLAVFSLSSFCAYGAEATAQAIVLKVTGSAQALSEGQGQPVSIKVGDKISQGATIVTAPNSEVDVQAFNGAVATIKGETTVNLEKLSVTTSGGLVTKQTALLNLKVGVIVSNIDPANHNINDYGIRTPKGVAAARGTKYKVSVTVSGQVKVTVTDSTVVFLTPAGVKITVHSGEYVTIDGAGNVSVPKSNDSDPDADKDDTTKKSKEETVKDTKDGAPPEVNLEQVISQSK